MTRTTHIITNNLPFVVDPASLVRNTGRQIDWDAVTDAYRQGASTIVANGAVSVDDTSMTVDALPVAIPAGTNLYFGGAKKLVRVTAAAAAGATSLTIEAAPTAIDDDDEAFFGGVGDKLIPAGTCMAELSGGKVIPRAVIPGSETAMGFLETNALEDDKSQSLSGFGVIVGGNLYENLLPDAVAGDLPSTYLDELNAANVGTGFAFEDYADNRGA